jgi:hypothetical protein
MFYGHYYSGFHHGHGFSGRAFEAHAFAKILVVLVTFILAVVARYVTTQWVQNEYDDERKANAAGWIAFLLTLLIVGVAGLKFL